MKAIVQDRYGSPDVLELRDIDKPVPGEGEVLVQIKAASVNAYDWHFMRGDPYIPARLGNGLRKPKSRVRGRDFAGVVEAVGAGVEGLSPGDEVYGEVDGTFAEYACVPRDWVDLKPSNLTFEQAATLPLAANTALMGLRDKGEVKAGQRVLINGASGGVGHFAVQIGRSLGAEVTAVCSTRNVELARSLGADHVIDYTREDFTRTGKRYDVVIDFVATRSLTALRRAVAKSGKLVLGGGGTPGKVFGAVGLIFRGVVSGPFVPQQVILLAGPAPAKENLVALRELAESGKLAPVIDRTYPLSDAAEAIRYVEVEHARGKVVVTM